MEPLLLKEWGESDEANLEELKKMEIGMKDTALGRLKQTRKREMMASMEEFDMGERVTIRRKLDELDNVELTAV